jgi:hypothetical protein
MSSQNIPLKARTDFLDPAEFWPQRLFAYELRRGGDAALTTPRAMTMPTASAARSAAARPAARLRRVRADAIQTTCPNTE